MVLVLTSINRKNGWRILGNLGSARFWLWLIFFFYANLIIGLHMGKLNIKLRALILFRALFLLLLRKTIMIIIIIIKMMGRKYVKQPTYAKI